MRYLDLIAGEIIPGRTVGEILERLCDLHPELRRVVFTSTGEVGFVTVVVNDVLIKLLQGLETAVADRDSLVVWPMLAA